MLERLLSILPKILLRNERDLSSYVIRTTALCVAAALSVDVVNQLVFFESLEAALRSWLLTVVVVVAIAAPVSRTIGKAQVALYRASTIDALTGLLNRGALLDGVSQAATFVGLIIVDVDHFKHVNDKYGHWVGDQVLRATAGMLKESLSEFGRVGRLGGEEFAVLAFNEDGSRLLQELERLCKRIAETPIMTDASPISITVSGGVAIRRGNQTFEQLFTRADRALYVAKASGRNKIIFADELDPMASEFGDLTKQTVDRRQSISPS